LFTVAEAKPDSYFACELTTHIDRCFNAYVNLSIHQLLDMKVATLAQAFIGVWPDHEVANTIYYTMNDTQ